MSDTNKKENFFYDSDEEVCWGPVTMREIKRDLKRGRKIPTNYRRQTDTFIPYPLENNSETCTVANSSHSSKDYFTANESMESNNIQSSVNIPRDVSKSIIPDCLNASQSVLNRADQSECSEVIALSSDSEYEDEKLSCSQSTKYNSFSSGQETSPDIICLSSSDGEEFVAAKEEKESFVQMHDTSTNSFEDEQTLKCQSIANTPVKKNNYSFSQSTIQDCSLSSVCEEFESAKMSRQTPKIRIIARTPVKKNTDSSHSSFISERRNSSFASLEPDTMKTGQHDNSIDMNDRSVATSQHADSMVSFDKDTSDEEIAKREELVQLNCSKNSFHYRDDFLAEDDELATPLAEREIPKIKIISNTPIKGPNVRSNNDSYHEDLSSVEDYERSKQTDMFNESEDQIEVGSNNSENINSFESPSNNAQNTLNNDLQPLSSNTSSYKLNLSQNENEYDYCEEINHTLSSKLQSDLSLKHTDEQEDVNEVYCTAYGSVTKSKKSDLSGIHSLSLNSSDNRHESFNFNQSDNIQNESTTSKIDNMHDESMSENNANSCLNDTFAEMEKLLTQGFDSDSDDSSEEIIDSTSCNNSRPAFGNSSIHNISRIPVPRSFSDDSRSNSSINNEFKVPKLPTKTIKKTPVNNKLTTSKTSPLLLKNIVSPVRLYINNSPVAALKQTNKPTCTKSLHTLHSISESTVCVPRKRRNLLDSLPQVVYKPSKLVSEKCYNQIILPNNIRKLITERIVIKHEPRSRINPDESMYSVQDKLAMRDLSVFVSDEQNMSVHTTKQGFNL